MSQITVSSAFERARAVIHDIDAFVQYSGANTTAEVAMAVATSWQSGRPGVVRSAEATDIRNIEYGSAGGRRAHWTVRVTVQGEIEDMAEKLAGLQEELNSRPANGEVSVPTSTTAQRAAQKVADAMVPNEGEDQRAFYYRRATAYQAVALNYEQVLQTARNKPFGTWTDEEVLVMTASGLV